MADNESRQNPTLFQLTRPQEMALEAIVCGQTVTEAAKAAGVHRCTVHEWLRSNAEFKALLNARRREVESVMRVRLMGVCAKAIDLVERAMDEGDDVKDAMELLKGMGLLRSSRIDGSDPDFLGQMHKQREVVLSQFARASANDVQVTPVAIGNDLDY